MGGLWDSIPRYQSYEQMIKENYGNIDLEYVKSMLGCTKYWDGKAWVEDTLDPMPFEDPHDLWAPEARIATDQDDSLDCYGRALTHFCEAQAYAQMVA